MSQQAPSATAPSPLGERPRLSLHVELRRESAGVIEFKSAPDHLLSIHAGAPARVSCRARRRYTRGDVNLVPAGLSGAWVGEDASTSLVLRLSPLLLRQAAEDMGLDPDRAGLQPRHQFRDPQIEHVAWALEAEHRAGCPNGRLYTDSLGMALAFHLLGRYPAPLETRSGLSKEQLQRVTEYIEAHLDQNLSLVRLARVAGMSASHLKTLFKRSTGRPVHEYVIQRRVERAKVLLRQGALPVSQVALEAGFAHQSHMARWMRRVLGVTPGTLVRRARAP